MLIGMSSFMSFTEGNDPYKSCCGAEPVLIKVGGTKVFVPNVFTPNGDGLNDVFKPFYDQKKLKIQQITISNAEGKTVWTTKNFNPEKSNTAWSGWVNKDSTYTGLFNYSIVLADEKGAVTAFGGSACSAVCNPKIPISIPDKNKCFFPIQYYKDSLIKETSVFLELESDCLKK
jgi:gliding motility-associated-like protein